MIITLMSLADLIPCELKFIFGFMTAWLTLAWLLFSKNLIDKKGEQHRKS
jgi:hypothetical protein